MPQRKTHANLTSTLLFLSTVSGVALIGYDPTFLVSTACFLGGITVTYLVNPDNDLDVRRIPWVYKWIGFTVYKDLVQHRQGLREKDWQKGRHWSQYFFYSHFPYVGTLLRTALLLFPVIVICLYMSIKLDILWFVSFWLGMGTSDLVHVLADILLKEDKNGTTLRCFNRRRKSTTNFRRY